MPIKQPDSIYVCALLLQDMIFELGLNIVLSTGNYFSSCSLEQRNDIWERISEGIDSYR